MLNILNPLLPLQRRLWPLFISFNLYNLFIIVVFFVRLKVSFTWVLLRFISLCLVSFMWWKDINKETLLGYHTSKLEMCIRSGMIFFILSEVFFFVRFFWAFFDASLIPVIDIGIMWPPKGIFTLSIYSVPLLNTILLLRRGLTVTWAHHSLLNNLYLKRLISLLITIILGTYFIYIQYEEYRESRFSLADRVYGSTFFIVTGFHGFHVILGTLFLIGSMTLVYKGRIIYNHHFSFEFAAWYWHFVDVVWLFLFISIYWWGRII